VVVAHAGLFYAAGTATAADLMNDVISKTCELLDREILILMDPHLSEGLPENLLVEGFGHCKGLHQLTSSLLQQLRALSTPSRNMSFSCEGNNQDIVPCGMSALNQLKAAADVGEQVLRAASFVALRAYLIRQQALIPSALHVRRWPEFKTDALKVILKITKQSEENFSLAASS
jgi:histidine ammonia-lyase